MIIRQVLNDSSLLKNFDYMNDATDTINWLHSIGTKESKEIANQLAKDFIDYMNALFEIKFS